MLSGTCNWTVEAVNHIKSTQQNPPITELITITIATTTSPEKKLNENEQSQTACGHWYSTILIAFKSTRSCIMTLEGSVPEYLSHKQNRKPDASQILVGNLQIQTVKSFLFKTFPS